MMTQSVMTQAANLFGNAAGSVTSKGKQTGTGFDMIINSSRKTTTDNTEASTATPKSNLKTEKVNKSSDDTDGKANQTDVAQNKATTESDKVATKKIDSTQQDKVTTADKVEDETVTHEGELTVDEQFAAEIVALLQNVQQSVMDALNLTSEDFEKLLADQGMNLSDLLQRSNLQQFILASNGATDITAVLMDENLAAAMNDLLQVVEAVKAEAGLDLTGEQVEAIISKLGETQVQTPVDEVLVAASETKNSESEGTEKIPEAVNSANVSEKDSNINVNSSSTNENVAQATKAENTSEGYTGTQDDARQEEQQEMKASDQFQAFIDNLVKTTRETPVDFSGNMVRVTELRDIANQIIERIKVSISTNLSSMELQLNPENLGKVNLTVQSKNGVMTAQFVVQNEISKEAIESQLHTLRETLNSQGIKVEAIEVTVASYAFDQNNQDNSQNQAEAQKNSEGRKITLEDAMSMTEIPTEDNTQQKVLETLGSQIDYTA